MQNFDCANQHFGAIKNPLHVVQEVSRVLRPGGSFVIGELDRYSFWSVSRRVRGMAWLFKVERRPFLDCW